MFGKIKSWFTDNLDSSGKTLHLEVPVAVQTVYDNYIAPAIINEIKERVVEQFFKEYGETIKKSILKDKHFADKVYNAIVLKKADRI